MTHIDITGQRYGRLVALRLGPKKPPSHLSFWYMQCDCGNIALLPLGAFRCAKKNRRVTKSCGCWYKETRRITNHKHGLTGSSEYRAWSHAKARCHTVTDHKYRLYGARGIVMCEEWRNSFEAFFAHVGKRPIGLTLDRIDTDGHYEPGNVRWATHSQQNKNRRPFHRDKSKNQQCTASGNSDAR